MKVKICHFTRKKWGKKRPKVPVLWVKLLSVQKETLSCQNEDFGLLDCVLGFHSIIELNLKYNKGVPFGSRTRENNGNDKKEDQQTAGVLPIRGNRVQKDQNSCFTRRIVVQFQNRKKWKKTSQGHGSIPWWNPDRLYFKVHPHFRSNPVGQINID